MLFLIILEAGNTFKWVFHISKKFHFVKLFQFIYAEPIHNRCHLNTLYMKSYFNKSIQISQLKKFSISMSLTWGFVPFHADLQTKAISLTEQAFSDSVEEKLPFNRRKPPAEPGSGWAAIHPDCLSVRHTTIDFDFVLLLCHLMQTQVVFWSSIFTFRAGPRLYVAIRIIYLGAPLPVDKSWDRVPSLNGWTLNKSWTVGQYLLRCICVHAKLRYKEKITFVASDLNYILIQKINK